MVAGVLLCLEHPAAVGQAFNIGNPRAAVTIFDLAQRIKRLSGAAGEIVFQPLHYADVELRIPNVKKAREVLGWEPQVELDEGLEKTIAWYREKTLAIRLGWPDVGEQELAEVAEVLESGMLTMGPKVAEFEAEIARLCEVEHALAVTLGHRGAPSRGARRRARAGRRGARARLHLPGDRERRRACRACKPVLVDVDPETMNIDPAQIRVGPAHEAAARRAPLRAAAAAARAARRCRCSRTRPARSARATAAAPAAASASRAASASIRARSSRPARAARSRPSDDAFADAVRAAAQPRLALARAGRPAGARAQLPPLGHPLRGRHPAGPSPRRAARGAHADRRGLRGAPASTCRCCCRAPTRATSTAGRPTCCRSTTATGSSPSCARRGSRRRSAPTRCRCSAPTATRATFPGARRVFERALALPFHTRLSDGRARPGGGGA